MGRLCILRLIDKITLWKMEIINCNFVPDDSCILPCPKDAASLLFLQDGHFILRPSHDPSRKIWLPFIPYFHAFFAENELRFESCAHRSAIWILIILCLNLLPHLLHSSSRKMRGRLAACGLGPLIIRRAYRLELSMLEFKCQARGTKNCAVRRNRSQRLRAAEIECQQGPYYRKMRCWKP